MTQGGLVHVEVHDDRQNRIMTEKLSSSRPNYFSVELLFLYFKYGGGILTQMMKDQGL